MAKKKAPVSRVLTQIKSKILLVKLARLIPSPLTKGELKAMNKTQLIQHFYDLQYTQITEEHHAQLVDFQNALEEVMTKHTRFEIEEALRTNGFPYSGTYEEKAEMFFENQCPSPRTYVPDKAQREAIDIAKENRQTMFVAGPGAGKTSTLCRYAVEMIDAHPEYRIAILAFNRNASAITTGRLKSYTLPRSALVSKQNASSMLPGIRVMTFDSYAYQMRKDTSMDNDSGDIASFEEGESTYEDVLDSVLTDNMDEKEEEIVADTEHLEGALDDEEKEKRMVQAEFSYDAVFMKRLYANVRETEHWDILIVDEAQDVMEKYALLIEQLMPLVKHHIVVAGDSRQEIYPGARWMSSLMRDETWKKPILRENHRSHPSIVRFLNQVSGILFDRLHHDQIPASETQDDRRQAIHWHFGYNHMGIEAAKLIRDKKYTYANTLVIMPISTRRFGLEKELNALRQKLYDFRFPGMVLALRDKKVMNNSALYVGTSYATKGAEKDNVIVIAPDLNYTQFGAVNEVTFRKCLFVALSRARFNLHIVVRCDRRIPFILKPVLPPEISKRWITKIEEEEEEQEMPYIPKMAVKDIAEFTFWESGAFNKAYIKTLSQIDRIPLPNIQYDIDRFYERDKNVEKDMADIEALGRYTELKIRENMQIDIRILSFVISLDGEITGILRHNDEGYVVQYKAPSKDERKILAFQMKLDAMRMEIDRSSDPSFVLLKIILSAEIGRLWTLSDRLSESKLDPLFKQYAEYIQKNAVDRFPGSSIVYQPKQLHVIQAHRSEVTVGAIVGAPDFAVVKDGKKVCTIEHKFTKEIERTHFAQASLYASLQNITQADLINTCTSEHARVEVVPLKEVEDRVRASYALKAAKSFATLMTIEGLKHKQDPTTYPAPRVPTVYLPLFTDELKKKLIFVDIETANVRSSMGSTIKCITEIGAVCIEAAQFQPVVDTFHLVANGVRSSFQPNRPGNLSQILIDESDDDKDAQMNPEPENPAEPWIPFTAADLEVFSRTKLMQHQTTLKNRFVQWAKSLVPENAPPPALVHWRGDEPSMLAAPGMRFLDGYKAYKWYLEHIGHGDIKKMNLRAARAFLFANRIPFVPHRAFEDAVMTAAVIVGMQRLDSDL